MMASVVNDVCVHFLNRMDHARSCTSMNFKTDENQVKLCLI